MLHVNMIMLHVDMNKLHMDITMLHVDKNYFNYCLLFTVFIIVNICLKKTIKVIGMVWNSMYDSQPSNANNLLQTSTYRCCLLSSAHV